MNDDIGVLTALDVVAEVSLLAVAAVEKREETKREYGMGRKSAFTLSGPIGGAVKDMRMFDHWLLFFFFYAFVGWLWESCYVSVQEKRWINRGAFMGPLLPIYGFGALAILYFTQGLSQRVLPVFLVGMLGTTALEYVTGLVLDKRFHVKYWDYSRWPFQLHGYISLLSSLFWGVFSVVLVKIVHPVLAAAVARIPEIMAALLAITLTGIAAVDFWISIWTVRTGTLREK